MTENDYISLRLDDQIEWYGNKSSWNQKWYKRIKNAEMLLSASIPIVMGFWSDMLWAKMLIASSGAVIAVLAGVHGLYNFHENWIEYRATSETLKHEKYMFQTRSGIYSESDHPFQTLVERIESVISHENLNWAQINKKNNTKIENTNSSNFTAPV